MKIFPLLMVLLLSSWCTVLGQFPNSPDLLVKNKVNSSVERQCMDGGSSCTVIFEKYDRKGNVIEFNFGRLGTLYRYVYDEAGNEIMTLWVDKGDSTEIDTLKTVYDDHNNVIQISSFNDTTHTQIEYDGQGKIKLEVEEDEMEGGRIRKSITEYAYTPSGKLSQRLTTEQIFSPSGKIEETRPGRRSLYRYNEQDLKSEVHILKEDTVIRSEYYKYDEAGRLLSQSIDDPKRVTLRNDFRSTNAQQPKWTVIAYRYTAKGQLDLKFSHYSDPCMGVADDFFWKHHYLPNGLLSEVEVYEWDGTTAFTISYDYSYFE